MTTSSTERSTKLFWQTANGATTYSRKLIGVTMLESFAIRGIPPAVLAVLLMGTLAAQESPSPSPSPSAPARNIRVSFVPPPLDGTISLGIYDAKGKLVRVLNQEAKLNEFAIGADALVTQWDGKNDEDAELPAGKYHARGYLVGPIKVE